MEVGVGVGVGVRVIGLGHLVVGGAIEVTIHFARISAVVQHLQGRVPLPLALARDGVDDVAGQASQSGALLRAGRQAGRGLQRVSNLVISTSRKKWITSTYYLLTSF